MQHSLYNGVCNMLNEIEMFPIFMQCVAYSIDSCITVLGPVAV